MQLFNRRSIALGAAALFLSFEAGQALADRTLLNVSYDPTREFYKEFNAAFAADWKARTGDTVPPSSTHWQLPPVQTLPVRLMVTTAQATISTPNCSTG